MAHTRADIAVATIIATIADWTLGTNCFYGGRHVKHPNKSVHCILNAGIVPIDLHPATGTTGYEPSVLRPRVQILIREDLNKASECADEAEAIRTLLHLSGAITDYFDARVIESGSNDLGVDNDGRPERSLNVDLWVNH